MPVILRVKGYRFFFFSNEGNPLEMAHIHVRKGEKLAKFWLLQEIGLAESFGFSSKELREITEIIAQNRVLLIDSWHAYFNI
jgi:hypothetical protein